MKKAVILTGGKQYLVSEGQTLEIDPLKLGKDKTVDFVPLLVIDGDEVKIGMPDLKDVKVSIKIMEDSFQKDKVTSIRYKAKKRVHTIRGHRQQADKIEILTIK
jgi:large subunit ribosomal protein L21